jgi:hypothetical protein
MIGPIGVHDRAEPNEETHHAWTPADATSHTKKATTAKAQRLWAEVANKVLEDSGDEGRAIREANAVVARLVHADERDQG